ncbi:MAG: hypothetical protein IAF38_22325, partial [Bacteroidia bacterium]|nr:hypothetical protein [Bacteroidia bacterium]
MKGKTNFFLAFFFFLFTASLSGQIKLPKEFEAKMEKFGARFNKQFLTEFKQFTSKQTVFTSNFVMFKNAKEKMNIAYYIDTCLNGNNLMAEYGRDLPLLFGLTEGQAPKIYYGFESNYGLANADDFATFKSDSAQKLLVPFTDYKNISASCYYNNYTKAKLYIVINYGGEKEYKHEKYGFYSYSFIFNPHLQSAEVEPKLTINSGFNDFLYALDCSPSGKLMACGGLTGVIKIMLGDGSKELRKITAHSNAIRKVSFSQNEKLLASCSLDSTIKIWEVETGKLIATFKGHKNRVNDVGFYDKDRMLLSTCSDSTIKLWDVEKKICVKTIKGFNNRAGLFAMDYARKKAAIDVFDGNIMLLDLKSGNDTLIKTKLKNLTDICFPFGNLIVITDGTDVKTIDLNSGVERIVTTSADSAFTKLTFKITSDNNMHLVVMTDYGYCKIYDYDKHEIGNAFHFGTYASSSFAQTFYKVVFNENYNIVYSSSAGNCYSYDFKNGWFNRVFGTGWLPYGVETDQANELVVVNFIDNSSLFSLKSGRIIWSSVNSKLKINGLSKISKYTGNVLSVSPDSIISSYDCLQNKIIYQFKPKSFAENFVVLQNDSCFLYRSTANQLYLHKAGIKTDKIISTNYTLRELVLIRDSFLIAQEKNEISLLNV